MFSPYFSKFGWKTAHKTNKTAAHLVLAIDHVDTTTNTKFNETYLNLLTRYNLYYLRWYTTNKSIVNGYDFNYLNAEDIERLSRQETFAFSYENETYVLDIAYLDVIVSSLSETQGLICLKQFFFIDDSEFLNTMLSYFNENLNFFFVYFSNGKANNNLTVYSTCGIFSWRMKYYLAFLTGNLLFNVAPIAESIKSFYEQQKTGANLDTNLGANFTENADDDAENDDDDDDAKITDTTSTSTEKYN